MARGVPIADATNAYPMIPAVLGTDNVAYQVVASNAFGCVTSAVSKVKVSAVNVWGDNANKQRTVPTTLTNPVAIAAGVAHGLGLNANGSVVAWGRNSFGQSTVPAAATNVIAIAAGGDHSLAVRANGSLIAWGRNSDGQTNVPPVAVTTVVAVAAGWAHSLVLQSNGNVIAWGNNDYHQTNVPTYVKDITAIAAGYYHSLALKWDGSVIAWGNDEESFVPATATNVVAIVAGWEHSMALRGDGTIIAWGDNSYGQTDIPAAATNVIALAAGYYHSLALRGDGTVIGWGKGHWGVLNIPGALSNVTSIATGEDFSMAMVKVGPPVFTPGSATVTAHLSGRVVLTTSVGGTQPLSGQWFFKGEAISGATNHFLVLDHLQPDDAGLYTFVVTNAWGETNTFVVNLIVDAAPYLVAAPVRQCIPPYTHHGLLPTIQGVEPIPYQWRKDGTNLLEGDRINGATARLLQFNTTEFGDSGNYELIVSNSAGTITGLVSQLNVTPIVAWGKNYSGQLDVPTGMSNVAEISAGAAHTLALTGDGTVVAWGDNKYGQTTIPATATNVVSISAGENHNLALRGDGSVLAWGDNQYGQRNVPASATNIIAVAAGAYNSFGLRSNGTLVAWSGASIPSSATNIIAVDTGGYGFVALRTDGLAVGSYWVSPQWTNLVAVASGGMLGLGLRADGTVLTSSYPGPNIAIPPMDTVAISAGNIHALTLDADGTVRGWGETNTWHTDVPYYAHGAIAISAGGAHSLALVQVSTNLNFTAQPENHSVAAGANVNLNAAVTGRGPVTYQWYLDETLIATATNASHSFSSDPSKVGDYFVVASNPWNSITSSVASVSIPSAPIITTHPQSRAVTPGTTVVFNAEAEGSTPLFYQWRFEGNDLTGETTPLLQLLSVTTNQSGHYTVYVTNSLGAATSTPATLRVIVPSELNLDFSSGSPLLSFEGTTGASYLIQYSTNLASSNWLDLIILSNPAASFQFIDTNNATNGSRFYRAVGN